MAVSRAIYYVQVRSLQQWDVVISILGGIVTFLAGAVGLATLFRRWRAQRSRRRISASFDAAIEVYSVLQDLTSKALIPRVMVIKLHNGGGRLSRRSQHKISVLHEVHGEVLASIREAVQNFTIDHQYRTMLAQLQDIHFLELATAELPHSWLKSLYESQGVASGYLSLVGYSDTGMYFLAGQSVRDMTATETTRLRVEMGLAANAIAQRMGVSKDREEVEDG